jgi:putative sigma-54 modulation protein
MEMHVTSLKFELTPELKKYVETKLQRLEQRDSHIIKLDVSLHIENVTHSAEGTLQLRGGKLHAEATADNMYSAIDLLEDKLKILITKHKEKLSDHHR